jgi:glutathione-independent formaldehyde dehydrogenase
VTTVLHGRTRIGDIMPFKVVSLDEAPDAYASFEKGEAVKYLIDPHNTLRRAAGA